MKRYLSLFVLLAVVGIVGCGDQKSSTAPITNGRGTRQVPVGAVPGAVDTTGKQWGTIFGYDSNMVKSFASGSVAISQIGDIGPGSTNSSPVEFWGNVRVNGGAPLTINTTNAAIDPTSSIRIAVLDSLALSGKVPEIETSIVGASGTVSANSNTGSANIIFSDSVGTITLNGTIAGDTFSGQISYTNIQTKDSSGNYIQGGSSGSLGQFSIRACSFFVCQ